MDNFSIAYNADFKTLALIEENENKVFETETDTDTETDTETEETVEESFENLLDMVDHVLYNLHFDKKTQSRILTTVLFFKDGTRSIVKNSIHDMITLESIKLEDNKTEVVKATDQSKEIGFIYALIKKLMGYTEDNNFIVQGNGYLNKIHKMINNGIDQTIESAKEKIRAKHKKNLK